MVNLHNIGGLMANLSRVDSAQGGSFGDSNSPDVRSAVAGNLNSLLGSSAASQPEGTKSRGLGSMLMGALGDLDERKVNAAHERAYDKDDAKDMNTDDLGAAAGKEVFDLIFGGKSSGAGEGTRDVNAGSNTRGVPDAAEVAQLFGQAAGTETTPAPVPGATQDRGFLDSVIGAAGQAGKPPRQKDTFEKIVDLISREVAKFMGKGNSANPNDVAAAATQTFTQLMIKKKIYSLMGKEAPQDRPQDQLSGLLGGLGIGGNKPQQGGSGGGGGLGGLASSFLGGGSGGQQQSQQQSSSSGSGGGLGALAGMAASALGGGKQNQQQNQQQQQQSSGGGLGGLASQFLGGGNNNNNNQQQQQQQSQQQSSQSSGGGFGALAGMAASALGGGKQNQQQSSQQDSFGQQGGNYGQQSSQSQSSGGGFGALAGMAASALGGGNKPSGQQQGGNYGQQGGYQQNQGGQQSQGANQGYYGNQQDSQQQGYNNQQGGYNSNNSSQQQQSQGGGSDFGSLLNMAGQMLGKK